MVSIIVPKTITKGGKSDLHNALFSRFIGVRPLVEVIKSWI